MIRNRLQCIKIAKYLKTNTENWLKCRIFGMNKSEGCIVKVFAI